MLFVSSRSFHKPDVLCIQETKCNDEKFPVDPFTERGYHCQLFGQQSYNGVAIVSRGPCETRASMPVMTKRRSRD